MKPAKKIKLMAMTLFIVVAVTFGQCLSFDFTNWDDDVNITQNQFYRPVAAWSLKHFWTHPYFEFYLPVVYTVWGLEALATQSHYDENSGAVTFSAALYHGTNIVVHALNALLVFLLITQIVELLGFAANLWPAFLGALIFALHPMQVEPVAWVTGLKDLLGGFFGLACLNLFLRARRRDNFKYMILAWLAFALGMLSKTGTAGIFIMMIFLDVTLLRRSLKRSFESLWPFFVTAGLPVLMALGSRIQADRTVTGPPQRILVAIDALGFYINKIVWPFHLMAAYERSPRAVLGYQTYWITGMFVIFAAVALFKIPVHRRAAGIGAALFVAGVYPYLGLVTFTGQNQSTVADRYVYLGMIGVAFMAAVLARRLRPKNQKIAAAVIVAALLPLSAVQAHTWRDTQTVFRHCLDINPDHGLAHFNLASDFHRQGRVDEAIAEYKLAIEKIPDDEAIASMHFLKKVKDEGKLKEYNAARRAAEQVDEGVMLAKADRLEQAQKKFDAALAIDPKNFGALVNTANIRAIHGDVEGALHALLDLAKVDPDSAEVFNNLGNAYVLHGDYAKAAASFRHALEINPGYSQAKDNLDHLAAQRPY